jgi:SAM-dependent methyltransferase
MAELYAALFLDDVRRDENAEHWLARFAERASLHDGVVADLGCGPGHVTDHLTKLGLDVIGSDLSPGQIEQARLAFPDRRFSVGDMTRLDDADDSLAGIVARYSIIHLPPTCLVDLFVEWSRVLRPGAPLLISFFGSMSADAHGTPFDHRVVTAYELRPATIARHLTDASFVDVEVHTLPPVAGERPFDQATVLATAASQ